ncbi:hypothetical protein ACTXJ9_11025 [Brachybacterium tyrofermentans]|uniref:hypothetical protein n=1 Tax=Brachybacterium tyrofermentans TaxID=47848 RepID=UPI003FD5E618
MTTLYRPVLIESAEHAEALPAGTYAKDEATTGSGTWYAPPRVNIGRGMWSGDDLYRSSDMVGWSALMPIEAEEETRPGNWFSPGGFFPEKLVYHPGATRLVTPWEEA